MCVCLHRATLEHLEGANLLGTLKEERRGDLGTERLCLWELCEGNLERGLLLMGTLNDMYKKALETGVSFLEGPRWGPWRGQFFTGDFEKKVRFYQETVFIGEPERRVKEDSGNGQLSP